MVNYLAAFTLSALCLTDAFTVRVAPAGYVVSSVLPRRPINRRSNHDMTSIDPAVSSLSSSYADAAHDTGSNDNVELWLDLRDTAILPSAALEHMKENRWQSEDLTIDRVLISEDNVARVAKQDSGNTGSAELDILFVSEDDCTVRNIKDEAIIVGGIVTLRDCEFVDPIPALDILSKGGWIIIDSNGIDDENKRDQAVMGLVDFLSAGASSSATGGSLLLGTSMCDETETPAMDAVDDSIGGIVLSCSSKTDVLRAGASSQSIITSSSLTTTEGGILIQARETATTEGSTQSLRAAVAIPFDAMLWKAVSVVFEATSIDDDDEALS